MMNRKKAETRFPIVKQINQLAGEFDNARIGVVKNFKWNPDASLNERNGVKLIVENWHNKCRQFKKSSIQGVAIPCPASQLLELCEVKL